MTDLLRERNEMKYFKHMHLLSSEKRSSEQRSSEKRSAEERSAEKRERLSEERLSEERLAEERLAEERLSEERSSEKRSSEKRSSGKRSSFFASSYPSQMGTWWSCGHCQFGPMSLTLDVHCTCCYRPNDVYARIDYFRGEESLLMMHTARLRKKSR